MQAAGAHRTPQEDWGRAVSKGVHVWILYYGLSVRVHVRTLHKVSLCVFTMPRCACASEVYGSVFVCVSVCLSVCLCV